MAQKRVTAVADPWPEPLRAQLAAFSQQLQTATAAAPNSLATHVSALAVSSMPEQRTQILARIGESLAATTGTVVDQPTRTALVRAVFLPLLFDSRARYLNKSVMNLMRTKLSLDEAALVREMSGFAASFLQQQLQLQQRRDSAEAAEEHWLRVANDLDGISITLMSTYPAAFDSLAEPLLLLLRNVSEALIVPHLSATASATSAQQQREVMTETQTTRLRFACRVVATIFHKVARQFRAACASFCAKAPTTAAAASALPPLLQHGFHLAGASAAMLRSSDSFPKDLLNTAGLLVATALECAATAAAEAAAAAGATASASSPVSSNADMLATVSTLITGPQQQQQASSQAASPTVQQRAEAFHGLLLALQPQRVGPEQTAALLRAALADICTSGCFSLLRGFLSHFSGMGGHAATAAAAHAVFEPSSSSASAAFAVACYDYAARWADRVDEPEARFLAIQTLDSVVRCVQETFFRSGGQEQQSMRADLVPIIARLLDGVADRLLALWDDPTMNVSGPLFDTFDRIIQCKAQLELGRDGSNGSGSSSCNFIVRSAVDLLRQPNHERRGKWQVLASLFPRMSLDEIYSVLAAAARQGSSLGDDSSADTSSIIATFLVPILCGCATSNKCNSLCGDVVMAIADRLLHSGGTSNTAVVDDFHTALLSPSFQRAKSELVVPLLRQCAEFYSQRWLKQEQQQRGNSNVGDTAHLFDATNEAKTLINCVVTHLLAPCFKSAKIGAPRAFQLVVSAALDLAQQQQQQQQHDSTSTAVEWILTFAAWRARAADLPLFTALDAASVAPFRVFLERALVSPENDIRCAAVEVLTMPTRSLATPLTPAQVAAFFSFCQRNWATGDKSFGNSLVTLIKKVLARLVDTARHTQWKESVLAGGPAATTTTNEDAPAAEAASSKKSKNNKNQADAATASAAAVAAGTITIRERLDNLCTWQAYARMIISALSDVMRRIEATLDTDSFSSDRAMTNVILLSEFQDCMLQFVGSPSASATSASAAAAHKKSASVLSEIERVSKLLDERVAAAAAGGGGVGFGGGDDAPPQTHDGGRWASFIASIVADNAQRAGTQLPDRLVALLSNGWTALRNNALALLVRSIAISGATHVMEPSQLAFLVPCRLESVVGRATNTQQALSRACELVVGASTLRSSSYGVAFLQLAVELGAASPHQPQQQQPLEISLSPGGNGTTFALASSPSLLFDFASFVCAEAERAFAASESDAGDLAAAPLHGFLACIGFAVPIAIRGAHAAAANPQQRQALFSRAVALSVRALNVAATYVGSHSNDVATAEHDRSRKVDCRGHIICDDADAGGNSKKISASHSRKIVNNAWLSVCCGGQTLERLISCSKLYQASAPSAPTMSAESAQEVAQTLLRILLNSKHNGVISKTRGCLRHLAYGLFRVQGDGANEQRLRGIPAAMMHQLLESDVGVKSAAAGRMLRRSQGLPHAIAPILESEDHSVPPVLLARTMAFLVDTAMEATSASFDESSARAMEVIADKEAVVVHGVNALNVLKFVFEDSQLGALARPWVEKAFLVALRGFESADWFLRNSSLMLFTVVAKRALGDQQSAASQASSGGGAATSVSIAAALTMSNSTNAAIATTTTSTCLADLFSRLPLALPAMAQALAPVLQSTDDAAVHKPSVFPILFVLSMLQPAKTASVQDEVHSLLADAVTSCLLSASLPARCSAAQAMLAVMNPSDGAHIAHAVAAATSAQRDFRSWDAVYGVAALVSATVCSLGGPASTGLCAAAIASASEHVLQHCVSRAQSCPSGVWSVVLKMTAAVRLSNIASNDALLDSALQFLVGDVILCPEQDRVAGEFHRTSADELYDNICLATLDRAGASSPRFDSAIIQPLLALLRSAHGVANAAIGSPAWRLACAAVNVACSPVGRNRSAGVAQLVALLLTPPLERTAALRLWERIHASRCMSICLDWLSQHGGAGGDDAALQRLICATLSESSEAVISGRSSFPPPLVLCSMFYYACETPNALASSPAALLSDLVEKHLVALAHPSQTADYRMTAARCVAALLLRPTLQLTWPLRSRLHALAVQLCFDDDPTIRRVATTASPSARPSCHISSVTAIVTAWKRLQEQQTASASVMQQHVADIFAALAQREPSAAAPATAAQPRAVAEDDDDESGTDAEDDEEDLFKKDEDNAFAEVGLISELLS